MAHSTLGAKETKHAEHFMKEEIIVSTMEEFQKILTATEPDLSDFANDMSYSGFDKNKIALLAAKRLGAFKTVKFCFLGGIRGTNLKKIIGKSKKVDKDIKAAYESGKILSNGSGPEDLTLGRLMATFPEITAYYMLKHSVPKKLTDSTCHPALQFPAAAGLPMNHTVRLQHLEFSIKFSFLISKDKKFYPQYYKAAFNGQQRMSDLSIDVQDLCGKPTDQESKSFDFDTAINAFVEKYGKDRFVLDNASS